MAVACTHCGASNPDAAIYCNRCGALLGAAGEVPPAPESLPPQQAQGEEGADAAARADAAREETILDDAGPAPLPQVEQQSAEAPPARPGGIVSFPREQPGGGFLEPVVISGELSGLPQRRVLPVVPGMDADSARAVRVFFQEDPLLSQPAAAPRAAGPSFRIGWISLLLLLALVIGTLAGGEGSAGSAGDDPALGVQPLAGAGAAYETLAALPEGAPVLVYWAYDPAAAGELDLAALPVVSHLLERRARALVVTTLPAGLPTARRLYAAAATGLQSSGAGRLAAPWFGDGAFLTGGAAALPLVAQETERALGLPAETPAPLLAVVFAAQPEDVQHWLELVQPVNALDVVAVTGAAGDPMLRPYLASGQLAGLVAGFDGAYAYQAQRSVALDAPAAARLDLQRRLQNWGGAVLLLALLAGNAAQALARERRG